MKQRIALLQKYIVHARMLSAKDFLATSMSANRNLDKTMNQYDGIHPLNQAPT